MKKVQIIETRFFYDKNKKSRLIEESGKIWTGTRAQAIKKIAKLESSVYYLSNNEYARPEYSITYRIK